jgi:hypothetical protein
MPTKESSQHTHKKRSAYKNTKSHKRETQLLLIKYVPIFIGNETS